MTVKIDIKSDSRYPVNRKMIRDRIRAVLLRLRVKQDCYVSVVVVGDRKMKSINKQYRNKDYSTDVLSFPTYDPSQEIENQEFVHIESEAYPLGDIMVAYPQAVKIASQKNKLLDEVICDLVEHGLMHLMGIHHD